MSGSSALIRSEQHRFSSSEQPGAEHLLLPRLPAEKKIKLSSIRDKYERFYYFLMLLWLFGLAIIPVLIFAEEHAGALPQKSGADVILQLMPFVTMWTIWRIFPWFIGYWQLYGNGIVVGPSQYPQIYRLVKDASQYLDIHVPTTIILQGQGFFQLLATKRLGRRGAIVLTSHMVDELLKRPTSREFMMYIGVQLGHIKAGHLRFAFFKDVICPFAFVFYFAWRRRCKFTADRVGMLLAGDLNSAIQALCIVTSGSSIAPSTDLDSIIEQRSRLFESFGAWVLLGFLTEPYVADRISKLSDFARRISLNGDLSEVGTIPIEPITVKSLPLLLIHGHDRLSFLELRTMLFSKFPHVAQRVMLESVTASISLAEKFELVASDAKGAIALLTPDDMVVDRIKGQGQTLARARQNVVVEIGWIWGKLGRKRCLLLSHGAIELPSDLSGADVYTFRSSPEECLETIRSFVSQLELGTPS